jgi:hypothetical protein
MMIVRLGIHHAEAKNYEKPKRADPSYYGDGHDDTGDKKIQVKSKRIRHDAGVYRRLTTLNLCGVVGRSPGPVRAALHLTLDLDS